MPYFQLITKIVVKKIFNLTYGGLERINLYRDIGMKKLDLVSCILLIVGGLNWGLVGFFDFNFIEYFVCRMWLDKLIYVFIGFAALYHLVGWKAVRARARGAKR